jgi:hypothetical protein
MLVSFSRLKVIVIPEALCAFKDVQSFAWLFGKVIQVYCPNNIHKKKRSVLYTICEMLCDECLRGEKMKWNLSF